MVGPLTEQFGLQTHLCKVVMVTLVIQVLGCLSFAVLLPNSVLPVGRVPASALLVVLFAASLCEGVMAPMIYELGAELTYPYSESFSGAVFSWILNAFGLVLLVVFPLVPVAFDSFAMAGACFVALLSMFLVREEYPRRVLDEQAVHADGGFNDSGHAHMLSLSPANNVTLRAL